MASDEKESDLYTKVRDWVASDDGLGCHTTWTNKGIQGARPDVTGLRHVGGYLLADFELVTIEVKKSSARFLTSAGQAAAYGVFADRAYLCCSTGDESFDKDSIDIASHLGIGLVEINEHNEVSKVLAAPIQRPIPRQRQEFLHNLGWVVCLLCSSPFRTSTNPKYKNRWGWNGLVNGTTKLISKAVREKKGYAWWRSEIPGGPRFLCLDCTQNLFYEFDL
jgi:hypothetical protein